MKKDTGTLGTRLKDARKRKGLTQVQLANAVGTTQDIISKIERGEILHPRNIVEIAKAVDATPAWLQFGLNEIDLLSAHAIRFALAYESLPEDKRQVIETVLRGLQQNST